MKRAAPLLGLTLLAACVRQPAYLALAPGTVTVLGQLAVKADGDWNRLDPGGWQLGHETWTHDGVPLDELCFYLGIGAGEAFEKRAGRAGPQQPHFQKGMQPREIIAQFEALATRDGSSFTLARLAPALFGGAPGFRFDYSLVRAGDRVILLGTGFAAVHRDQLHLMVFQAPRLHHYPAYLAQVEALAATARILQ